MAEVHGAAAAEDQGPGVAAFDWLETVQVPLSQFQPNDERLEYLRQHINPLGGARDSLGTDVFEHVLNFLSVLYSTELLSFCIFPLVFNFYLVFNFCFQFRLVLVSFQSLFPHFSLVFISFSIFLGGCICLGEDLRSSE